MSQDLIRGIDSIARDKNIPKEAVYTDVEQAIASGLRKHYGVEETTEFQVQLDRMSGNITINRNGTSIPISVMGRIGAQTVKQVMIQLFRQDERGSIYDEYMPRVGTIVTGTVTRREGSTLIVNLGRAEGIMRRSDQIPGENHDVGERVQALITEVQDTASAVKIFISRTHAELIRRLFEREVPEVGERTIEIKALAREPGHRTKIAVTSIDSKVDAVGACVGVRGSRIKNIVEELGGEKIDIVRWNESSQVLIQNALKPAEVAEVVLCFELTRATVVVKDDQLSLAIGKRGQNVRLAAKLTGWDVDILTPGEYQKNVERLDRILKGTEGVTQEMVDKIVAMGLIDVRDVEEVGETPLMEDIGMEADLAERVVDSCVEEAKIVLVEVAAKKAADAAAKAAGGGMPDLLAAVGVRGMDGLSTAPGSAPTELPAESPSDVATDEAQETQAAEDRMPGMMEAAPGGSPETVTHKIDAGDRSELSPEERRSTWKTPSERDTFQETNSPKAA